jgi:hypothetical protein
MKLTSKRLFGLLILGFVASAFSQPVANGNSYSTRPPDGPLVCRWRALPPAPLHPAPVRAVPIENGYYQECTQYRTHHQWVPQGTQVTYFVPDSVDFR